MRERRWMGLIGLISGGVAALAAACGPTAEPTATTAPVATSTTAAVATATTGAVATATTAGAQPTATRPAPTSTVEDKLRPVPVIQAPVPNPTAQKGGIFRSLVNQDPANFGIWDSGTGNTLAVSIPITDSVLDRNDFEPNKSDQLLPALAYDWWTDKTGAVWTFKIRQGVKFTDGHELDCGDVKFSLDTIKDVRDGKGSQLSSSPRNAWFKRVKTIACADANTLVVTADGPLPSLAATLAVSSIAVLPQHAYEGKLDTAFKKPLEVGVGPYMFDKYTPTESYNLKRNPGYWNQPFPFLDGLAFQNVGSTTAVQAAFRVGRGESGGSLSKTLRDQLEAEGKVTVWGKWVGDGISALQTNWTKAPYNDKRFALALRCAINDDKVIKLAFDGEGFEGSTLPLPGTPGGPTFGLTKEEWKAIGPCYGPTAETDMAKRQQMAKDLLAQMGFNTGNPAKPKVVWQNQPQSQNIWASLDADLRAVGIQPNTEYTTSAQAYDRSVTGDFDIINPVVGQFITSRRDPDHWFYEQFYSTSDRNYGRYTNPETDALIDKQSRTLDPVERNKIIKELSIKLLQDNAKVIYRHTFFAQTVAVWVKDAYPGEPSNSQNTYAKFQRVWIDQAKMKQMAGQ